MIRDFSIFYKLKKLNITGLKMFHKSMDAFDPTNTPCPSCGTKHPQWRYHASYQRYLIDIHNGQITQNTITVARMRCDSCNHTHAILPECLIPHGSYSLIFVLTILQHYYLMHQPVWIICERFQISHSTLYAWHKLFLVHKKLWLGLLDDFTVSPRAFLNAFLSLNPSLSKLSLLLHFYMHFACSFLQGVSKNARLNSS
jgi:hypothetical protein